MFSNRLFRLSDFETNEYLKVERDCGFAFAGKILSDLPDKLVGCKLEKHVEAAVKEKNIRGLIVPPDLREAVPGNFGLAISDRPIKALNEIQAELADPNSGQWRSFPSKIDPSAIIMPGAYVAPNDVIIAEGVIVHPNAVVLPRVMIGKFSSIGPGVIVGTDAFEVDVSSSPRRTVVQSGGVKIGEHVEIQASCTIVRATYGGFTEIGNETKLDCQVHLAHDSKVGEKVRIAACAEISGRVTIMDDAFLGPNVSISNGVSIGEGAKVTIGSVVTRDVESSQTVTGNFAVRHRQWLKFVQSIR